VIPTAAPVIPSADGWVVREGDCKILDDKNCISDNHPGLDYTDNSHCDFDYIGEATITTVEFEVDASYSQYGICIYDALEFNGVRYCADPDYPDRNPLPSSFEVSGTTNFLFYTDEGYNFKGFHLCAAPTVVPVIPTAAPVIPSADGWVVREGDCKILDDKNCISDNHPGLDYTDNSHCAFDYIGEATITTVEFEVDASYSQYGICIYDALEFNGVRYCADPDYPDRNPLPSSFEVSGTTNFLFYTDEGYNFKGFHLCAAPTVVPVIPTAAPVIPSDSDSGAIPTAAPVVSNIVDSIDSLLKLQGWCNETFDNCMTCRGSYSGTNCNTKPDVVAKCRKFKGTPACDMIVGCRSVTNKRGKVKCKGKKHGLV